MPEYFCIEAGSQDSNEFQVDRQDNNITINSFHDLFKLQWFLDIYFKEKIMNTNMNVKDLQENKAEGQDIYNLVFMLGDVIDEYLVFKKDSKFFLAYEKDHIKIMHCIEFFFKVNPEMQHQKYEELKFELFLKVKVDNGMNTFHDHEPATATFEEPNRGKLERFQTASFEQPNRDKLYSFDIVNTNNNSPNLDTPSNNTCDMLPPLNIDNSEFFKKRQSKNLTEVSAFHKNSEKDSQNPIPEEILFKCESVFSHTNGCNESLSFNENDNPFNQTLSTKPASMITSSSKQDGNSRQENSFEDYHSITKRPVQAKPIPEKTVPAKPVEYNIITGDSFGRIKETSLTTGKEVCTYQKIHIGTVQCSVVTPDYQKQFTGGSDGKILEWDLSQKKLHQDWGKCDSGIVCMLMDKNAKVLITGGLYLKVWNIENQELIKDYGKVHEGWIRSMAITSNGEKLFTADDEGVMKQWDFVNHKLNCDYGQSHIGKIYRLQLSPDEDTIYSIGRDDKRLIEWSVKTGDIEQDFGRIHDAWMRSMVMIPDINFPGRNILMTGDSNGFLRETDSITGAVSKDYGTLHGKIHEGGITCIVPSLDQKRFFTTGDDKQVKEWDMTSKSLVKDYGVIHPNGIWCMAIVQN